MCPAIKKSYKDLFVQTEQTIQEDLTDTPENLAQLPSTKVVQQEIPTTLKCSRCKLDLSVEKFYKTTNYWCSGRGYSYVCRDCAKASATASRLKKQQEAANGKADTTEG